MNNLLKSQTETDLKRKTLTSLLNGEIQPIDFIKGAKENGLNRRVLSLKEELIRDIELWGKDAVIHIGGRDFIQQEALNNFEEYEKHIIELKKSLAGRIVVKCGSLGDDPDCAFNKILCNPELAQDEKDRLWEEAFKKWE